MRPSNLPYDIQIAEPCTEDWNAMQSVSSTARHCKSCAREVHDLSRLSARDVQRLVKRTGGDFCGRVMHRADGSLVLREDMARHSALRPFAAPGAGFILAAALATAGIATSVDAQVALAGITINADAQTMHDRDREAVLRRADQHYLNAIGGKPAFIPLTAKLEGQLHAPGSTEVRDPTMSLTGAGGRVYGGTVSSNGHFEVLLPPGVYTITASVKGASNRQWFGSEIITLRKGSQTRDFEPSEPTAELKGQLHAPSGVEIYHATALLTGPGGREFTLPASEDGHYQLMLPLGEYRASILLESGDGRRWFGEEAVAIQEGSQSRDFRPSEPYTVTAGAPIFVPPRQAPKAKQ